MSIWTQSEIPCMPVHGISFWDVFAVKPFAFQPFALKTCKSLHERNGSQSGSAFRPMQGYPQSYVHTTLTVRIYDSTTDM